MIATRDDGHVPGLSVFATSNGDETPLTSESGKRVCRQGCWLPSSAQIVFFTSMHWPLDMSGEDLWIMDPDGNDKEQLASGLMSKQVRRFAPAY